MTLLQEFDIQAAGVLGVAHNWWSGVDEARAIWPLDDLIAKHEESLEAAFRVHEQLQARKFDDEPQAARFLSVLRKLVQASRDLLAFADSQSAAPASSRAVGLKARLDRADELVEDLDDLLASREALQEGGSLPMEQVWEDLGM